MAQHRGNKKERPAGSGGRDEASDTGGRLPALPELVRKAVGDTIPKDWTDFAVDQSERARREFLERLGYEIGHSIEKIDLAAVLRELLEGRTLEIRAEIRLGGAREEGAGVIRPSVSARLRGRGEED